jgi:hypothetical protein
VSVDLNRAKRRLAIMGVVNAGSLGGLAVPALYFYFERHVEWALAVFVGAVLLGFGAQIWFIASLVRARKGAR